MKHIKTTNGYSFVIDDEDYDKVNKYNWFVDKRGYVVVSGVNPIRKGIRRLHRYILNVPNGMVTDHINGNKLDNRKENLRICTQRENAKNRSVNTRKHKGQYKGVGWKQANNKWQAKIRIDGKDRKDRYLGLYITEEEGANVYNEAAYIYFGEFARLNKIDPDKLRHALHFERYGRKKIETK